LSTSVTRDFTTLISTNRLKILKGFAMNSLEQLIAERKIQKSSGLISQSIQISDARAEAAVKETLNANQLDAIGEIVNVQSNERQGYVSYKILAESAIKNELVSSDSESYRLLRSAFAEAIIVQNFRDARTEIGTPLTVTVYEPVSKLDSLSGLITDPILYGLAQAALGSIEKNKTPDILSIATTQYYQAGNQRRAIDPALQNVIDPNDKTGRTLKKEIFTGKTLVMPMEITIANDAQKVKNKITKFKNYKNPFPSSSNVEYIPILVLDRDSFMDFNDGKKKEIISMMNRLNGRIILHKDLKKDAITLTTQAARQITSAVAQTQAFTPNSNETTKITKNPDTQNDSDRNSNSVVTNSPSEKIFQAPTKKDVAEFRRVLAALKEKAGSPAQKHELFDDRHSLTAAEKQARTLGYSAILAIKDNDYAYGETFVFQRKDAEIGVYRRGDYTQVALIDLEQGEISINKSLTETEHSWLAEKEKTMLAQEPEQQRDSPQKNRGFEMG
jgi:hypothetical protein